MVELLPERKCRCGKQVPFHLGAQCSVCRNVFCLQCDEEGCFTRNCTQHDTCWKDHLPAKWAGDHRPVDPIRQLFARTVIHSETDEEKLKKLHCQDILARWFNIRHDSGKQKLRVYDRFGQLCDPKRSGNSSTGNQCPSFVSFIGKSGVGKSTLVRSMILLGAINESGLLSPGIQADLPGHIDDLAKILTAPREAPVTRSGKIEHLADPTTLGVHLYEDGRGKIGSESAQDSPILFADCEGFYAGDAITNSERLTSGDHGFWGNQDCLLYEADITARSYRGQDKRGVELFYARFLYAISDVVVFVTNDDSMIQSAITNVLEWAAAAVFNSINHPSRKTLIIVRNMANEHKPELYKGRRLEELYLNHKKPLWEGSGALKQFVNEYNRRQVFTKTIETNEDLYRVLFSDIICCCIPNRKDVEGQPEELFGQYQQLRKHINNASQRGQALRSRSWMKYNIPSLSHILLKAFEHFRTSDEPFDFYVAARNNNPSPRSSSDHIANFLRLTYASSCDPAIIEVMVQDMIALSFVTWALRNFDHAVPPEDIFDRGEDGKSLERHCQKAFKKNEERYQQCSFKFNDGDPCITRPAAVHIHHQSTSGKRFPGAFVPRYRYTPDWTRTIRRIFFQYYTSLVTNDGAVEQPHAGPPPCIAKARRELVLQKYHKQWQKIKSNTTCLACLQEVPENVLPCGHAYCVRCVRELGKESEVYESAWDLGRCALCWLEQSNPHTVRMKPRCAGVRLLTLDGGGIRGIIELVLIDELNKRMGLDIPFRDFFDLIIGTSTGGIVALAVAMQDRSIPKMMEKFMKFAGDTFSHPRAGKFLTTIRAGHLITKIFMVLGFFKTMFDSAPLRKGLVDFFGERTSLFASAKTQYHQCSTRVAVVSAKDLGKTSCLIASYNRPERTNCTDFEREDDDKLDMKIWEAALATSAAPLYLSPFKKAETGKEYVDGALYANCPAEVALEEMERLWPNNAASLDILLSLGTGKQNREIKIPGPINVGGFEEIVNSFHNNLDTEKTWEKFRSAERATVRERLRRINPTIDDPALGYVAIWDAVKMPELKDVVKKQMNEYQWEKEAEEITDTLLANLFYFEPDQGIPVRTNTLSPQGTEMLNGMVTLRGTIRCRLAHNKPALKQLLEHVDGFYSAELRSPLREIYENLSQDHWSKVEVFPVIKPNILGDKRRCRIPFEFQAQKGSQTYQLLAVQMKNQARKIPISGFPVTLNDLEKRSILWN